MPREIPGQIVSGIPQTERELFARLLSDLGNARDAARGLAHSRKDMRWLAVAGIFDEIKEKAALLMNRPNGIVVPRRGTGALQ